MLVLRDYDCKCFELLWEYVEINNHIIIIIMMILDFKNNIGLYLKESLIFYFLTLFFIDMGFI